MKIKLTEKFYIEQCLHAPFCWDLIKISYGNRAGKENVEVTTPVAYGLTLELLVKKITDYEIFESDKEWLEFQEYIKQYKDISTEIVNKLNKHFKK